jgi:formylglycine-generating enzyme required for sulfatase activity
MLPEKYQWVAQEFEPEGNPRLLLDIAQTLEEQGNLEGSATVYDRAYGIDPTDEEVSRGRARVLDRLAVVEHGLRFRYVPAGPFLMGSADGDPDEGPRHPVWLSAYWLAETPISWDRYCRLMGWPPPVEGGGFPPEGWEGVAREEIWGLGTANKLRLQYCEDETTRAVDWHAHDPNLRVGTGGQERPGHEVFGRPPREDPEADFRYDTKPMIAVAWQDALDLAARLSGRGVVYSLPTEAQWEKGARGGLIGARYAWGDEPAGPDRCDCDRFRDYSILPMKTFPPNGYGLYAVNGCAWEWTRDWYDRDYYRSSPDTDPAGPAKGEEKVLRGGSWADCAEAATVTFRMSRRSCGWRDRTARNWGHLTPTVGFRLCRTAAPPSSSPPGRGR